MTVKFNLVVSDVLASWSNRNAFVSGAGGLRFKSQAGQINSVFPTARTAAIFF